MSMPIKVGGKGLIPRGYGIAPRKEPFMADLTLIQTIMAQGGLTVDYVRPGGTKTVRLTSENLKRTYQMHEEKFGKTGKSVFTKPAPNQELPKEPDKQPDADPKEDNDLVDPTYTCQGCGIEFKYADKRTPAEGDPILCPTCEEAAKVKAEEDAKKAKEEEEAKAKAAKADKVKELLELHFSEKVYQGPDEAVAGLIMDDVTALVTDEAMKITDLNLEAKTVAFEVGENLFIEFKFQLEELPADPEDDKKDENNGGASSEDNGFTLKPKTQENPDNTQGNRNQGNNRNQGGNNRNNKN